MELDGIPVTPDDLSALALVNYGHFTSMRVDGTRVRGLELHLDRLVHDCQAIFAADLDPERVRTLARRVAEVAQTPAIMRVTVFDPDLGLGHPAGQAHPRVLVTLRPVGADAPPPIRLKSVRYTRDVPRVKHTGLFGTVYHRRAAQADGFDDVLFVGPDGYVSEGATWNIAFVEDGRVTWPAAECLPGVTMRLLNAAISRLGIEVRTAPVTLDDLHSSCAAFITNAAVGLRPVRSIDGTELAEATASVEALRKEYDTIEGDRL
jgi:branched-subunit amino acid aminotransferase/4-amino-4-deoxychorismate lyase